MPTPWIPIGISGEITLPKNFRMPVLGAHGDKNRPGAPVSGLIARRRSFFPRH